MLRRLPFRSIASPSAVFAAIDHPRINGRIKIGQLFGYEPPVIVYIRQLNDIGREPITRDMAALPDAGGLFAQPIKNGNGTRMPISTKCGNIYYSYSLDYLLFIALYVSVIFEWFVSHISAEFTGDWSDVAAYFAGSIFYYYFCRYGRYLSKRKAGTSARSQ